MGHLSTADSRIREISSTCTAEYRATLHYSDTNRVAGINNVVVVVKSVEEVKACPNSTETFS